MSQILLPLSRVRNFKLTIADELLLRSCARTMQVTEAEVVRLAVRRFAIGASPDLLPAEVRRENRRLATGLPLTPPSTEVVEPPDLYLSEIVDHDDGRPIPPGSPLAPARPPARLDLSE